MTKIWIDAGHGGQDSGAVGSGRYVEKSLNLNMALLLRDYLNAHYVAEIGLTRANDPTISLSQRTNMANQWGADFFISLHHNSASFTARGYEDFIYLNTGDSTLTGRVRGSIHTEVKNRVLPKYGLPNRGPKKADFHVLRETNMPAVLIETCFVSNPSDQQLLDNPQFHVDMVAAIGDGIASGLGLPRKAAPAPAPAPTAPAPSGTLYRVVVGAYSVRSNADEMAARLNAAGFSPYILTT